MGPLVLLEPQRPRCSILIYVVVKAFKIYIHKRGFNRCYDSFQKPLGSTKF